MSQPNATYQGAKSIDAIIRIALAINEIPTRNVPSWPYSDLRVTGTDTENQG